VAEKRRREQIKVLAAQADARWEAKARIGEEIDVQARTVTESEGRRALLEGLNEAQKTEEPRGEEITVNEVVKADPWKQADMAKQGPQQWQPAAWSPSPRGKH